MQIHSFFKNTRDKKKQRGDKACICNKHFMLKMMKLMELSKK